MDLIGFRFNGSCRKRWYGNATEGESGEVFLAVIVVIKGGLAFLVNAI